MCRLSMSSSTTRTVFAMLPSRRFLVLYPEKRSLQSHSGVLSAVGDGVWQMDFSHHLAPSGDHGSVRQQPRECCVGQRQCRVAIDNATCAIERQPRILAGILPEGTGYLHHTRRFTDDTAKADHQATERE